MGRRRDDDDERPVRRPKKKKKGGNTTAILIVLGIAGVVVLLAGCAVGGYFALGSAKTIASGGSNASGKPSAGGQSDGPAAAEALLINLATSTAFHSYQETSPAFKSSMLLQNFYNLVDGYPLFVFHKNRTLINTGSVTGTAPNRKQILVYELSKPAETRPGTKTVIPAPTPLRVTITVGEQPSGPWKVDSLSAQ